VDQIIGKNIRYFRLARNMSQKALASEIGITSQQLQKYEKASNRVPAGRLFAIAHLLAVPVPVLGERHDPHESAEAMTLTLVQSGVLRLLACHATIPDSAVQGLVKQCQPAAIARLQTLSFVDRPNESSGR
jgi:transcriptional regulator with XRE-family HTH domain